MINWKKKHKVLILPTAFLCLFMLTVSPALASLTTSVDDDLLLNDGAYVEEIYTADPNDFAYRRIVSQTVNGNLDSNTYDTGNPVYFSEVPYVLFEGHRYFQFIFDAQEPVPTPEIWITDIRIFAPSTVNTGTGIPIFDMTETIYLNSTTPLSYSPQDAGGDFALYIPVSLFADKDLTGGSTLNFESTISLSFAGNDSWILDNEGMFFDDNDPIVDVPIPGAVWLLGSGIVGLVGIRRKFKK